MSDIVTALAQHTLDVGRFYIQNATLDRGVPNNPDRILVDPIEPQPAPTPTPPPTPQPTTIEYRPIVHNQPAPKSLLSSLLPLALASMTGAGIAGLSVPFFLPKKTTVNETTIVRPTTISPKEGSLLQYLEDKGYHLPPEKRPK